MQRVIVRWMGTTKLAESKGDLILHALVVIGRQQGTKVYVYLQRPRHQT